MNEGDSILFSRDKANVFFTEPRIAVGKQKYPVQLIKTLLSDEYYYLVKRYLKDESDNIGIYVDFDDELFEFFKIIPSSFVVALEQLIMTQELTDKEFDRALSLRSFANFDRFIENYKGKYAFVMIDNVQYKIKLMDVIRFLNMTDGEYRITMNAKVKSLCNMPRHHFVYAVNHIMTTNRFLLKYAFPEHIIKKMESIGISKDIDIEALNSIKRVDDPKLKRVAVNQALIDEVLIGMPGGLDPLECAIYIYIKLCKVLTYDPLFFALDQRGKIALAHEDINRISRITPKNNRVVCYEFNAIYGYFLNMFDINYISSDSLTDKYGGGHAKLQFRVDKFIINADAVKSVLDGDLVRSKVGAPLNGLRIDNKNEKTRKEFEDAVERVYSIFKREDRINEELIPQHREELYLENLSIYERLELIIAKANERKLAPVDNLGYILRLKSLFYSGIESRHDLSYVVLRSNEDDKIGLKAIFTIIDESDKSYYFIYEPNGTIEPISKDKLADLIYQGNLEYLSRHVDEIPNLDVSTHATFGIRLFTKTQKLFN